jgi:tetratricopeptide (TPR) repeat protein
MRGGQGKEAIELLTRARAMAEDPMFSDVDRAEILFRLGACRVELSSIQTAISLFNEALALAENSELPCDRLRADIFGWRSRCYRRQRDWEAAREDVERALELAQAARAPKAIGHLYFQASILAQRQGHWVLARNYAERAREFAHWHKIPSVQFSRNLLALPNLARAWWRTRSSLQKIVRDGW